MNTETSLSEIDTFLPEGIGHWKTENYDIFLAKENNGGSSIIFCSHDWDFEPTLQRIKNQIGMEAWNTAFKFISKRDFTFLYLKNDFPIHGNGLKFIANQTSNQDFTVDVLEPLLTGGFIPLESLEWFNNYESN